MKNIPLRRTIAWLVVATMTLTQATQVAALTLATQPLAATTTSVVRPNLMYVLDDSGSMAWDFTPDYINDATVASDPGSQGGSLGDGIKATILGGLVQTIVASAPPFNTLYTSVPAVVIQGGGGTGASATVNFAAGAFPKVISSITVTSGGGGYTSLPFVALVGGLNTATWGMCWGTTGASNQGGVPKDTVQSPSCTINAQMPYATSAVNYQYYDSSVRYVQPLNADGTNYTAYPATAAPANGFAGAGSPLNLTTNWQHEVWCNASVAVPTAADPTAAGKCRQNADTSSNILYPDAVFTFRKTYNGPASYFNMSPAEYCTDKSFTNCVPSTSPTIIGGIVFNVPSGYRWCSFYNPLSHTYGGCQAKRDLTHYVPNYLGGWISTGAAGAQATGSVTINPFVVGQSIIGLTVGGSNIIGGTTVTATATDTQTTIATSLCNAVNANTGSSGYGCAPAGSTLLLQAAMVGTAANGLEIRASGPPDALAQYSTGKISMTNTLLSAGFQITSIQVDRGGGNVTELISSPIVSATGNFNQDAVAVCQAINSGPNVGSYQAESGDLGDPLLAYGTCRVTTTGFVGITRTIADVLDNGAAIKVFGPPGTEAAPVVQYSGSIIITSTGGATKVDDITLNGTTVLTSKPLNYVDGTLTTSIAADIVSKFSRAGCTASYSSNTIAIVGSAGCNGTLAVLTSGASATGKFHVASSGHPGVAGDLGGITVGATSLVGHVTASQITDGTLVSANATTLQGLIGGGFTAAAPVAGGGGYDVTVTAPAGNTYNGSSFSFLNGNATPAGAGSSPTWTFNFQNATTDNKHIVSVKCGGIDTITQNLATTGNATATDYIANLSTVATTNGLNGRSFNGYSYACTSTGHCTLTGPVGAAACTAAQLQSGTTADPSISFANYVLSNPGSNGIPTWTFTITGATSDSKKINSITCNGVDVVNTALTTPVTTVTTGTPSNYIASLTSAVGGLNGKTTGIAPNNYSWSCPAVGSCTVTGPSNVAACTTLTPTVDSGITVASGNAVGGVAPVAGFWTFSVTDATTDNRSISQIRCGNSGAGGSTSTSGGIPTLSSSASTGTTTNFYAQTLANNLKSNSIDVGPTATTGWRGSINSCTATGTTVNCTVARWADSPNNIGTACSGGSITITKTGTALTVGAVTPHDDSGFDGTIRNYYTFSITNVTNPSESINQIACSGNLADATLSGPASTGGTAPTQKVQRFENLRLVLDTQSRNGFTTSCPTAATAGGFTCTVQGPATCTAPTLYFLGSNNPTGISVGGTGLTNAGQLMGSYTAATGGGRPTWSFNVTAPVSGSAGDNLNISAVTCNGSNTFSPASTPNTGKYAYIRINNLANSLATNGRNSYSTSCSPAATAGSVSTSCTITGPAGVAACTNMVLSPDATITASQPTLVAGSGAIAPVWTFDISNATTASKTITSIQCGGTNTFNTTSLPNSGNSTLLPYQRVNNLTQGTGTGLQTIGTNGYSYSCQTATASSVPGTPGVQCTLTGPPGVANCVNLVGILEVGANITVANITRTSAGSASTAAAEDFQPFLATVTPFGNGSSAQSYSKTNILGVNSGTINTSATAPNTEFMSNGSPSSTQTIPTNATGSAPNVRTLGGGSDPDPTTNHWSGVGVFKRVDIVPGVTAYNRTSGRTDCVGVTCTYAEELQNFSNWYTYYRTRMQMMKAATTQAFTQLNGSYRVGFDNICAASGSNVIRTVAQFVDSGGEVSNQRTNWWSSLTSASPSCATPLRAETAKIGRYYGHKLGVVADPLQYSCQQNFTILVTDGYWNENEPSATSLTGGDIGNVDNNSATVPRPFFDGAQASTSCPATGSQRNLNASSCRTLADIAWYYYSTDLRSAALGNATGVGGADVATDNVQITSDDPNQAQHVNFFAMGLGIDGFLDYRSDYQTAGSGDYANIKSGSANWPAVSNLDPSAVDDLWHATVNGHGKYFSARNLPAVVAGLREALNKIGSRVGAASAAATSNLEPVNGDNFAYVASYATSFWVGDLQSRSIDLTTGQVSPDTNCGVAGSGCQWSAQAKLDNLTWSARRLFLAPTSNTSGDPLRSFDYNNFTATEQGYFDPSSLSQYTTLSVSNPADITAQKLTRFLRGFRGLEQDGDITHPQIWRQRSHVLGDVVNTQPTFMKAPNRNYTDPGYVGFKTSGTAASRRPVVFVSAQDGMLHAFNADTAAVTVSGAAVQPGEEMWAYVPKQVMPVMKTLADVNYIHRYFVDGPITVSDVNFGVSSNDWHTILVAGQGAGGNSYLALDVTDPLNPLYLWEFTDSGLGNTISNSTITKLADGSWAVIFTSGYNNADGIGRVYALNPKTGLIKTGYPLSDGSGSGAFPSNLGRMAVVAIDPALNNTIKYVYAGDLNGDLWRFDFTGLLSLPVFKLAHLASGATVQPITTKPEVSLLADGTQVVYVGTGKYLETADLANTDPQSFYAIKDTLGAPNLGGASQSTWDPKTDTITVGGSTVSAFLARKFLSVDDLGNPLTRVVGGTTQSVRAVCPGASSAVSASTQLCVNTDTTTMDWSTYGGWMVDLPDTGERLNVDMKLVLGTLVFASNIPQASSCTVGGSAIASELDSTTGLGIVLAVGVPADIFVGSRINNALVVGVTVIKLASGQYIAELTLSSTLVDKKLIHVCTTAACSVGGTQIVNPGGFSGQRGQWREFEAY